MIISISILIGLALISSVFLIKYNFKAALALLIPLTYATYYYGSTKIPDYFGYAVPLNFVDMDQARFISGIDNGKVISILIIEKGLDNPRLVSIPSTEENKKKLTELDAQAKSGVAVMRKAQKGAKPVEGNGRQITESDIEAVPMKDQEIISK